MCGCGKVVGGSTATFLIADSSGVTQPRKLVVKISAAAPVQLWWLRSSHGVSLFSVSQCLKRRGQSRSPGGNRYNTTLIVESSQWRRRTTFRTAFATQSRGCVDNGKSVVDVEVCATIIYDGLRGPHPVDAAPTERCANPDSMAFPDNSTYMEFGDDAHLFEEHNSGTFDFQHMAADNTAFTPAQPTTIRGLVQQDRSKQPSYLSSLNRSSNNQGRGTGLSTRTAPTGHPSGDLSSLESTLKRVRPLQSDTR